MGSLTAIAKLAGGATASAPAQPAPAQLKAVEPVPPATAPAEIVTGELIADHDTPASIEGWACTVNSLADAAAGHAKQASEHAEQAVYYAYQTGLAMIRAKNEIPPGKFGEFKKMLTTPRPTLDRYTSLAKKLSPAVARTMGGLPEAELPRILNELTGDKGLTGVYADLGIIKRPDSTKQAPRPGGAMELKKFLRETHPEIDPDDIRTVRNLPKDIAAEYSAWGKERNAKIGDSAHATVAAEQWIKMLYELRKFVMSDGKWALLDQDELAADLKTLKDVVKFLDARVK